MSIFIFISAAIFALRHTPANLSNRLESAGSRSSEDTDFGLCRIPVVSRVLSQSRCVGRSGAIWRKNKILALIFGNMTFAVADISSSHFPPVCVKSFVVLFVRLSSVGKFVSREFFGESPRHDCHSTCILSSYLWPAGIARPIENWLVEKNSKTNKEQRVRCKHRARVIYRNLSLQYWNDSSSSSSSSSS